MYDVSMVTILCYKKEMDSLREIMHQQQNLSDTLVVETSTTNNSSRNTSPISLNSGRHTRQQHATVVMVSTLINSNNGGENNGLVSHQNHNHHGERIQMHTIQRTNHDNGNSADDLVLGQLSVNTNNSVSYNNNIVNNTRSRIITHGHNNFGLELIKQERQSHHMGSEVSGGCGSSSSVIDDDLDHDDCDDVTLTLTQHHHQSQHQSSNNHHSSHNHHHGHHSSGLHHSSSISNSKLQHEALSVIVQPHDDSHEDDSSSQLLSPSDKMTPTSAEMIDTSDFRTLHEPTYQTLTSVNDRMTPHGFSPNSQYATLTPLQPLPPISTMSDKFSYGHSSNAAGPSFTVMQNNNMGINLGMGVNSPYSYDKLPSMGISPPHNYSSPTNTLGGMGSGSAVLIPHQRSPLSPQSSYSQNGLHSPQKSMSPSGYDSPYGDHRDLLSSVGGSSGGRQTLQSQSPLSPQSVSLHSPSGSGGTNSLVTSFGSTTLINGLSTIQQPSNASSSICSPLPHSTPPGLVQITHMRLRTPSPPAVLTIQHTAGSNVIKQQQQQGIATKSNNGGLLTTTTLAAQQTSVLQSQSQNGK